MILGLHSLKAEEEEPLLDQEAWIARISETAQPKVLHRRLEDPLRP